LQGDANIADWFNQFGVESIQHENGIMLKKGDSKPLQKLILNFIENPDIAQTMACLCVAKRIPFHFTGLKTLKIKETDRIAALQNEFAKFGASLTEPKHGELEWDGQINLQLKEEKPVVKTYRDHRMALAFAPMALAGLKFKIEDPMVVTKSYPGFWEDLKSVGFELSND
jgi:3-phosphoshikimate 1-carboxyvinyltransferase